MGSELFFCFVFYHLCNKKNIFEVEIMFTEEVLDLNFNYLRFLSYTQVISLLLTYALGKSTTCIHIYVTICGISVVLQPTTVIWLQNNAANHTVNESTDLSCFHHC